jgi:hypothetical protein
MNKPIKNCLRKLCCNFCFMLLGTFSKAEISKLVYVNKINCFTKSIKIYEHGNLISKVYKTHTIEKGIKKICHTKKKLAPYPKKRKKIVTQSSFEIRELPKGEYTEEFDKDNNIIVTRKTIILKKKGFRWIS